MLNREIIGRSIYCKKDMGNINLICATTQVFLMSQYVVRKGKVNFTLEHATKAQRGSRGIPLLFP
jgi:hypothetical protein